MIQRIQSVYLLLAAIFNICTLFCSYYNIHITVNGIDTINQLMVNTDYPSILLVILVSFLPFFTIFLFKNRPLQIKLCVFSIIGELGLMGYLFYRVESFIKIYPSPASAGFWLGAFLPPLAFACCFLAINAIRSDEKLVKSVDRLR